MSELGTRSLVQQQKPRRRHWRRAAAGLAVAFVLAAAPPPVLAMPSTGGDVVQSLYTTLLDMMKQGRTLGESGRFAQLSPVIRRIFDLPLMTRLSVGPVWATLGDAQRGQLIDSFGRYISAIYAERFDSYHGQKLEVTGQDSAPSGIIVRSRIVKADGDPVKVDYLMHQSGASWLISDIYLDGTISELATRRSEFAAIIRAQGIEGLIGALNRKADLLTRTTARAE
jgi:phospholipid transport system substrate-binding protein